MRQRDLHILTSSLHSYTNDLRISAIQTTVRESQLKPIDSGTSGSSGPSPAVSSFNSPYTGSASSNSKWSSKWSTSISNRSSYGRFNDPVDAFDEEDGIWSEWTLRIRSAQVKDAGLYECQVSTEPKISQIFRLHVVGNFLHHDYTTANPRDLPLYTMNTYILHFVVDMIFIIIPDTH